MSVETAIKSYRINIPEAELCDLDLRLREVANIAALADTETGYGVPMGRIRALTQYWATEYDWRDWEAVLNSYPQFTTVIDGQRVHFLHVRSPEQNAIPLLLTHGWPGSVVEFTRLIEPLTDPRFYGSDAPAFDLVIPSLPGFGFSGPATWRAWGTVDTAAACVELMARLGYRRFGLHGNNAGAAIAAEAARAAPDRVVGMHVNQIFSGPPAEASRTVTCGEQPPQVLADGLTDSPIDLLAWHDQLMGESCSECFVLTNMMITWMTGTMAASVRYRHADRVHPPSTELTRVPVACSNFAEGFQSVRRFAERAHQNIVQWRDHHMGGHYPGHEVPYLLIEDLRDFFGAAVA